MQFNIFLWSSVFYNIDRVLNQSTVSSMIGLLFFYEMQFTIATGSPIVAVSLYNNKYLLIVQKRYKARSCRGGATWLVSDGRPYHDRSQWLTPVQPLTLGISNYRRVPNGTRQILKEHSLNYYFRKICSYTSSRFQERSFIR